MFLYLPVHLSTCAVSKQDSRHIQLAAGQQHEQLNFYKDSIYRYVKVGSSLYIPQSDNNRNPIHLPVVPTVIRSLHTVMLWEVGDRCLEATTEATVEVTIYTCFAPSAHNCSADFVLETDIER